LTQLNQVPVPYSFPGAAVVGQTKMVNTRGTIRKRSSPPHFVVRPNSLKAMRAKRTKSQMTHPVGDIASYKMPIRYPPEASDLLLRDSFFFCVDRMMVQTAVRSPPLLEMINRKIDGCQIE